MNIVLYSPSNWSFPVITFGTSSDNVKVINGDLTSLKDLVLVQNPDMVFIGGFEQNNDLIKQLDSLCKSLPRAVIIPFCPEPVPEFLLHVMQVGVRDVLTMATQEAVTNILDRIRSRMSSDPSEETVGQKTRRIAFMSAKAGDGGTCVTANIGAALAKDPNIRVLIIDLSLQFGDVEMYLTNKQAVNDLSDFANSIERLDSTLLDLMVQHISDNLHLIPSPASLEKILRVNPGDVEQLIDIVAPSYDFVLIDLSAGLDPISLRVLEKLDQMIIVSTLAIPSARRASQILRLWESFGYSLGKVSLVLNRCEGKSDVQVSDFERAVGKPVWRVLSREYFGIQESLLKGIPLIDLLPKSEFCQSILEWASEWLGKPIQKKASIWAYLGIK